MFPVFPFVTVVSFVFKNLLREWMGVEPTATRNATRHRC